jgi:hypothetical protein
MRTPLWSRRILPALLAVLLVPSLARSDEEKPKAKIQKRPVAQEPAQPGTQTAPAAGSEKAKTVPAEAGLRAIEGTVVQVFPERHAIIVQTTTKDHQVFVTPQTVLLRDGQPVEIKAIQPGDRVESCHFNAKNAIQKMSVASSGKAVTAPPPAPGKP